MLTNLMAISAITAAAWASLFPEQTLDFISELKRQLRLRVIRRTGEGAAKEVENRLYQIVSQRGIDREIVDEMLVEQHTWIVERLGERYADEILGEADLSRSNP